MRIVCTVLVVVALGALSLAGLQRCDGRQRLEQLDECQAELATQQQERQELGDLSAQLVESLQAQTEATSRWQSEAKTQSDKAASAAKRAEQVRVVTQTRVVRIAQEPIPTECVDALRWGAQRGASLAREWGAGR